METIKLNILKVKKIQEKKVWLLCEGNLFEYLNSLKTDFYEYAIQRKIVRNDYLDELFTNTVNKSEPFPVLTLTTECNDNIKEGELKEFDAEKVEILDGLQRTFRLWAHLKLHEAFLKSSNKTDVKRFVAEFKESEFGELFFELGIFKTSYIRKLIEDNSITKIQVAFKSFNTYFYVWLNLNEFEVVNKMLVLNLGQKSVSSKHQFELLFLHFYRHFIEQDSKVKIIRERQQEAKYLKGEQRVVGNFLFSSVVIAMLSFYESKAKRVNKSELDFSINNEEDLNAPMFQIIFNKDFIQTFLECLYEIDEAISEVYLGMGSKWFGKDTTLSGVFSGISDYLNIYDVIKPVLEDREDIKVDRIREQLRAKTVQGKNEFISNIKDRRIVLEEFDKAYENLSSRSVNIGNVVRRGIHQYVADLLKGSNSSWSNYIK